MESIWARAPRTCKIGDVRCRVPLRIAALYRIDPIEETPEHDAAVLWWKRVAQGLAARGNSVDLIAGEQGLPRALAARLRVVPYPVARWRDYDAILTFFDRGFTNLMRFGGAPHPHIVSNLGSVVGASDDVPGVYFFGERRKWLYGVQAQIATVARFVNVLTQPSRDLFVRQHGRVEDVVIIPQGVDRHVPKKRYDPFDSSGEKIVVYVGSIYGARQKEMNLIWQARLNSLGRELRKLKMRLCLIGPGDTERLDPEAVTYLGPVDHTKVWDYQYFAAAGVVLAQGAVQHNESTKLYHYLRAGLPVVSEAPVPNNHVLEHAGLGFVSSYGDDRTLAELLADAGGRRWNRKEAMRHMQQHHSWDLRIPQIEALCRAQSSAAARAE